MNTRLTVREVFLKREGVQNKTFAVCDCSCGKSTVARLTDVKNEKVKSCGCLKNEKASERTKLRNVKHGKSKTKLYQVWATMKTRCYNKNDPAYPDYGGRGIIVCAEWRNNFPAFWDWSHANNYAEGLTLDRKEVNGNYEPGNCRWVGYDVQARNKRNNRADTVSVTAFNETKSIREWLIDPRCKVDSMQTLCYRLGTGRTPEEALTKPSQKNK